MPHRNYFWSLIIFFSCTLFHRPNDYRKGLEFYEGGNFELAVKHFNRYYEKTPQSDSALYYLYSCYQQLNQDEKAMQILERLERIGSENENVYLNLIYYYRKNFQYDKLYNLIINLRPGVKKKFDMHYVLTLRLYAEILSGASSKMNINPITYARTQGYLFDFPDGKFYENDTLTMGNLIILLDRLIEPFYPEKFFLIKNISSHSFLYIPYMRLLELGVLEFNLNLNPEEPASVTTAAVAIAYLKKRGLIVK